MTEQVTHGAIPSWNEGDRLLKALKHAGMQNAEMALFLGVSRNTIGNYVSGRVKIDKRTRMLWAQRTDVSEKWLETGQGDPTPHPEGETGQLPETKKPVRHQGLEPRTRWYEASAA
jgi:transcriptional regulator with XRE-family HTH domain